jgi:hypothetical protein
MVEVPVSQPQRAAGHPGNISHRGGFIALAQKKLKGRLQEMVSGLFAFVGKWFGH